MVGCVTHACTVSAHCQDTFSSLSLPPPRTDKGSGEPVNRIPRLTSRLLRREIVRRGNISIKKEVHREAGNSGRDFKKTGQWNNPVAGVLLSLNRHPPLHFDLVSSIYCIRHASICPSGALDGRCSRVHEVDRLISVSEVVIVRICRSRMSFCPFVSIEFFAVSMKNALKVYFISLVYSLNLILYNIANTAHQPLYD